MAKFRTYLLAAAVAAVMAEQSIAAGTLVGKVTAERTPSGLTIAGTIQMVPPGTKIRVEIVRLSGRALKPTDRPSGDAIVGQDGLFRASLSTRNNAPLEAGTYTVQLTVRFNRGWQ